ncbi:MAG: hypothetical protein HGA45_18775 [Chloroflexales bacterium]|nr:hypothetical protein [Chloroflexales bacterium]
MIRRSLALALLALAVLLTAASPAAAQADQRCFPETGFCISGSIRAYWEHNGGLPVFGFPISEQRVEAVEERTLPVQWFERDRLELQADGLVTAGRLGARVLELQWRPWLPGGEAPSASPACHFFPATGYNVCGQFLRYWEGNGGLERFGYPLSAPLEEVLEGRPYRVQYFERRRLEEHPAAQGGAPEVLLGLLGRAVRTELSPASQWPYPQCLDQWLSGPMRRAVAQVPAPEVLGCPILYAPTDMPASIQHLERGELIWFDPPRSEGTIPGGTLPRTILAYGEPAGTPYPSFAGRFSDDWVAGHDLERAAGAPPTGLYAPVRGFGKVWAAHPDLAAALGWAREPEPQTRRADYQILEGGLLVRLYTAGTPDVVYVFGSSGTPSQVRKVTP